MFPLRVMLLRSAAIALACFALIAPSAAAATGGAGLPGGVQPTNAAAPPADPAADAPSAADTPATSPATAAPSDTSVATTVALDPSLPALPTLATAARRADDPVAQDLAALTAPSPIAAIAGHVVVVRPHGALSDLVDLADPTSPRVLLSSTRVFGAPTAGLDAGGRPVVVVSPCAGSPSVSLGQVPRCPLRSIDLQTGASAPLPSTAGALAGDLSGSHLVFTRSSPQTGVRLYESVDGAAATQIALPALGRPGDGWTASTGKPLPGSVRAGGFDIDGTGRIAISLDYASRVPKDSSGLWVRNPQGTWKRMFAVNTTFEGQGTRHILGPQLDVTGVTAYVEGVVDSPSFLGHWSDDGQTAAKISLRRSIGRATILASTAFDSGRLVFVDWLPGAPCGSEEALACGLRSVGPDRPPIAAEAGA